MTGLCVKRLDLVVFFQQSIYTTTYSPVLDAPTALLENENVIGIIYNPLSRKGANRHRVEDIKRILDANNFPYEYRETECPLDGIRVAREMAETCDTIMSIPMTGWVESLNASVAAGVVLSEFARQRRAAK